MEESVRRVQERLRQSLGTVVSTEDVFGDLPLLVFDEVVAAAVSADELAAAVAARLRERGRTVAVVKRYTANNAHHFDTGSVASFREVADQVIVGLPDGIVSLRAATYPSPVDLVRAVDPGTDIILGLNFGYLPARRLLVTDRPQEAFNLGLPRVVGYVSPKDARAVIPRFAFDDIEGLAAFAEERIIGAASFPSLPGGA